MIVEVVVDVNVHSLNHSFSYNVPKEMEQLVEVGSRVVIPFGPRKIMGIILKIEDIYNNELKSVDSLLDIEPVINEELLKLSYKLASETSSNLIQVLKLMIPNAMKPEYKKYIIKEDKKVYLEKLSYSELKKIKDSGFEILYEVVDKANIKYKTMVKLVDLNYQPTKKQEEIISFLMSNPSERKEVINSFSLGAYNTLRKKGVIEEYKEEVYRHTEEIEKDKDVLLSAEQKEIVDDISEGVSLIYGVTGSGKTEIYLNLIEKLKKSETAIVLVPEISITYQLINRFNSRFPGEVAVLHSGLSIGEQYDEFRKILRKEVRIVIGARSAVFAPFENIGMIIVDEEHEQSYKQQEMPKYHAREVAIMRGNYHNAPVVLGSATPSLESYARAKKGVYKLYELTERFNKQFPDIKIIDMKDENDDISVELKEAIISNYHSNKQSMILINRRGYSNFVICSSCGDVIKCTDCDVSLTYHKNSHKCTCHYCGFSEPKPDKCPTCGDDSLEFIGVGSEQVEALIRNMLPDAIIQRMDQDTTRGKNRKKEILDSFKNHEIDILIGTQMIAKGLDFEDVTLVGVISCDQMLYASDFRASEYTYQLLTQVAGRAGRHKHPGTVYLQTFNPDHFAIEAVKKTYPEFYEQEMKYRKIGGYVPYYFVATIMVQSKEFKKIFTEGNKIKSYLSKNLSEKAIILGPVVPYVSRIKNYYRAQIVIKYKTEKNLGKVLIEMEKMVRDDVDITIDRYPLQIG